MKEKPIIFCSDMVRAILEDRKNKTRRLDKLHEINKRPNAFIYSGENSFAGTERYAHIFVDVAGVQTGNDVQEMTILVKPKYQVGDRLWVRENIRTITYPWQDGKFGYGEYLVEYIADEHLISCPKELEEWWKHNWHIRPSTTIPSIHMPKKLVRLWLEVTGVRAERLQDITEKDAQKEGLEYLPCKCGMNCQPSYVERFEPLWDSLNAKRGYSWESNPYVWVISFRRIK